MASIERLKKDLQSLNELKSSCSRFEFQVNEGHEAPVRYRLFFRCATNILEGREVIQTQGDYQHEIDVYLDIDYPIKPPEISWKSKIFHPNILPSGATCILGGLWDPHRSLKDVCIQLMEMAGYKNFDARHALAGAQDAADWVLAQPDGRFPADHLPILDR